jgi:hypothetical protein
MNEGDLGKRRADQQGKLGRHARAVDLAINLGRQLNAKSAAAGVS